MANKLIIILVLLGLAYTLTPEETKMWYKLADMEKNKFGKYVLDTIQLELQSNAEGPADNLINLLRGIEDTYQNEQKKDDNDIMELVNKCVDDLEKIDQEIKKAKDKITRLEAEIDEKQPIHDEKVQQRAEKQDFVKQIEDALSQLEADYERKTQEWKEEREQHDKAQFTIEKAKEIIKKAYETGFLQKKAKNSSFVQIKNSVQATLNSDFKKKGFTALFKMLVTITSSSHIQEDEDSVKVVLDLCEQILDKIAESREIERRDFELATTEYNTIKTNYNALVEKLNGEIARLSQRINQLQIRLLEARDEVKSANERLGQKSREKDERSDYCNNAQTSYSERRQERFDDIRVVSDAISLLLANFRLLKRYIGERTGQAF